jgi:hypothetical protein
VQVRILPPQFFNKRNEEVKEMNEYYVYYRKHKRDQYGIRCPDPIPAPDHASALNSARVLVDRLTDGEGVLTLVIDVTEDPRTNTETELFLEKLTYSWDLPDPDDPDED